MIAEIYCAAPSNALIQRDILRPAGDTVVRRFCEMDKLNRTFVGTTAGALAGACAVGALIAITNYMSMGAHGAVFYVVYLSAVVGVLYGSVVGGLIGLVVGLFARNKRFGGLIGAAFGLIIAGYYFGQPSEAEHRLLTFGVAALPIGVLVGLAAAIAIERGWEL